MRGVGLPAAMLFAILGLMLAFAPRRALLAAAAGSIGAALAASFVVLPPAHEWVFIGCWTSVVLVGLSIYLRGGIPLPLVYLLALDTGAWAGLLIAAEGSRLDLVKAMPLLLLVLPALLLRERRMGILIKIVVSWLIAVSVLAALLPLAPTPGYVPDHME